MVTNRRAAYAAARAAESQPQPLEIPELVEGQDLEEDFDYDDDDDDDSKPALRLDDLFSTAGAESLAAVTSPMPSAGATKPEPSELFPTKVKPEPESSPVKRKVLIPEPGEYKVMGAGADSAAAEEEDTLVQGVPAVQGDLTQMFWLDAREDTFGNAGTVYLFGKIYNEKLRMYQSCCCRVSGIMRCIFVLPRPEKAEEIGEVVAELGAYMASRGISQRRMKAVYRWYAFEEPGVPREKSRWVKVRYPASSPPLGITDCSGFKTFSRVFGDRRSFLELLLLKRKLKGPSWLSLRNAQRVADGDKLSWCTHEFAVSSPKDVSPLPDDASHPPVPLTVMSVHLVTYLNEKQRVNEIAAMTCVVQDRVSMEGSSEAAAARRDA
eukprot:RCo043888